MLPSTLPVLQDGLLPCFDLPLPLLVVCQGVMRQGRSGIASAAKKPGVPPAEQGFGEYAVGSGWKAHSAMGQGLDYSEHQNNVTGSGGALRSRGWGEGPPCELAGPWLQGVGGTRLPQAVLKPGGREKEALGTRAKPHWRQPTHLRCSFSLEPK